MIVVTSLSWEIVSASVPLVLLQQHFQHEQIEVILEAEFLSSIAIQLPTTASSGNPNLKEVETMSESSKAVAVGKKARSTRNRVKTPQEGLKCKIDD